MFSCTYSFSGAISKSGNFQMKKKPSSLHLFTRNTVWVFACPALARVLEVRRPPTGCPVTSSDLQCVTCSGASEGLGRDAGGARPRVSLWSSFVTKWQRGPGAEARGGDQRPAPAA